MQQTEGVPVQRIRPPRVAELVASRLRDDILSGRLKEGDVLPSQESLFGEFGGWGAPDISTAYSRSYRNGDTLVSKKAGARARLPAATSP